MNKHSKIFIAGAQGLVGSGVVRHLIAHGYDNLITQKIELRDQKTVNDFFLKHTPEYVFMIAGRVGGIKANNTRRAEFIYDNTMIQSNVIHASYLHWVKKLLFTGSSCIYPRKSNQPILESYLLTGELEPTNEPYAIAKINGVKMCQAYNSQYGCNYVSVMPTNVYGINDKYDLDNCHVLPALLRKIITAKEKKLPTVEMWGTGKAMREFIYVDDIADAIVFLMNHYDSPEIVNIGTGKDISIKELAEFIKNLVGWEGEFVYNNQLDGMMKKTLDVNKLHSLGWVHTTSLLKGLHLTVKDIYETKKHLEWLK